MPIINKSNGINELLSAQQIALINLGYNTQRAQQLKDRQATQTNLAKILMESNPDKFSGAEIDFDKLGNMEYNEKARKAMIVKPNDLSQKGYYRKTVTPEKDIPPNMLSLALESKKGADYDEFQRLLLNKATDALGKELPVNKSQLLQKSEKQSQEGLPLLLPDGTNIFDKILDAKSNPNYTDNLFEQYPNSDIYKKELLQQNPEIQMPLTDNTMKSDNINSSSYSKNKNSSSVRTMLRPGSFDYKGKQGYLTREEQKANIIDEIKTPYDQAMLLAQMTDIANIPEGKTENRFADIAQARLGFLGKNAPAHGIESVSETYSPTETEINTTSPYTDVQISQGAETVDSDKNGTGNGNNNKDNKRTYLDKTGTNVITLEKGKSTQLGQQWAHKIKSGTDYYKGLSAKINELNTGQYSGTKEGKREPIYDNNNNEIGAKREIWYKGKLMGWSTFNPINYPDGFFESNRKIDFIGNMEYQSWLDTYLGQAPGTSGTTQTGAK